MIQLTGTIKIQLFRFYQDINVKVRRNNIVILSGDTNDMLLQVARVAASPDTLVSVDGAPSVTLSSLTTRRATSARSRKIPAAPDTCVVERDGKTCVVSATPTHCAPSRVKAAVGTDKDERLKKELRAEFREIGGRGKITASVFKEAAARYETEGLNFKAEALRISAKQVERLFR